MSLVFGGPGVTPSNKLGFGNRISLQPGQVWTISPAGSYWVGIGKYTFLQTYDPILQSWVTIGGDLGARLQYVTSDGVNYRLANLTGCAVGALVTNKGSAYTSAPTVTIASGNSIWRAVLGPYVTSVTVSNGGSNYTYAPIVTLSSPPAGGVQATAYCTLSAGAVSTVTLINAGAGYSTPPTVTFTNDPREGVNGVTQGSGAAATSALTGSGTVPAIVCVDPGSTQYSSVPSFTISGGGGSSLAATVIPCFTITAFASGGVGTGYTGKVKISGLDSFSATAQAVANPAIQNNLIQIREANIWANTSAGAITATGAVVYDGGIYTSVPTSLVTTNGILITATETITFTLGGANDTSYISS